MTDGLRSFWRVAAAAAAVLLAAAGPPPAPAGGNPKAQPGIRQGPPSGNAAPTAPPANTPDRVVASVEGHPITLSDLSQEAQTLPPNLRNLPFEQLYPLLLDRLVDHEALVLRARERGLEDDPAVKKQIRQATDQILETALLSLEAAPKVTEAAIRARYDLLYANHPTIDEVRARHILVTTQAEADNLIAELRKGADFAALARQYSRDPDGQKGGDLGFFARDQVWPGFGDLTFSLLPGQLADKPIHNEFGWHVVQVEERRQRAAPTYAEIHDTLRDQLMQQAVRQEVTLARAKLTVHEWNMNGSSRDGGPPLNAGTAKPQ